MIQECRNLQLLVLSDKPGRISHDRAPHIAGHAGKEGSYVMDEAAINVIPAPYVTVKLAAAITGLTPKAIRRKIEEGKWLEGREWQRSPDGGIFISIKGYSAWVERGRV
jgi:hypothetical protein